MTANQRLREYLWDARLSQTRLAGVLGCSKSQLSRVLAGLRSPTLHMAVAIEAQTKDWQHGPIRVAEWDGQREAAE